MNNKYIEARQHIAKAREALHRGDKGSARQLGEQAALLAPDMEDAWLVLAASDPNPHDALAYAQKALEIKPESTRARRGVEWASSQLKQYQGRSARLATEGISRNDAITSSPKRVYREAIPYPQLKINGQNWLYPALLIGVGCIVVGFAALITLTSPVFASVMSNISVRVPTQENLWAPVDIAKPAITPIDVSVFAPQVADTLNSSLSDEPTSLPTDLPTSGATDMPTFVPTEAPTFTPEATEIPGTMAMEIIADTTTSQYVLPSEARAQYPASGNGARWIDVDLTAQRVYAYESDVVVNSFLVSTGTWRTPTVTGNYRIWIKVRVQDMSGPGYYLSDVPYVMFFYKGYGFHGTYWHNNFGTPMSHGCVNLTVDDAAWLYNWASKGTVVNVHY